MYEYHVLLSLLIVKSNGVPAVPVPMPLAAYAATLAQSTVAASAALRGVYASVSAAIVFAMRAMRGAVNGPTVSGIAADVSIFPASAAISASHFATAAAETFL